MGRKILLVTTDQQRFDTLACNGGTLSRTPVVDGLAADGVRYDRAHPQSVVCMPSRSTILTGQHPSTHGVFMNGVPLPPDAPSVAEVLRLAGYRTALVGKAHFEPYLTRSYGSTRTCWPPWAPPPRRLAPGFEHLETANHGAMGPVHYAQWLARTHPEAMGMYCWAIDDHLQVSAEPGGDTGAPRSRSTPSTGGSTTPTGWPTGRSPGSTRWTPGTTGTAG